MHDLFKHAAMAWNPMRETRSRLESGTLDPWAMLGPFVAVYVGCTIVTLSANQFFIQALGEALGQEVPKHLVLTNPFARSFIYTVTLLIPILTVAMLPARTFAPAGKSAVLASLFALAGAAAFYHALFSAPIAFVGGVAVGRDPNAGTLLFFSLGAMAGVVNLAIMIWFWFAVLHGVLRVSVMATALIGVMTIVGALIVVGAMYVVLQPAEDVIDGRLGGTWP